MTGKKYTWKFTPEVVNGVCPTCEEDTLLVSITREYYRCVTCGTDLEQHVNGKIIYLPSLAGKTVQSQIDRIESILLVSVGALITGMSYVIFTLVTK